MSDMAEEFSPRPAPAARQTRLFYDPASYSAFPHVIRMERDELLVAFRQAPKVEGIRHTHPRSIITLIRSYDLGESWQIDAASQMGAGGGQELGLIYLGGGKVGGALAAHEVVHWHETERIAFRDPPRKEYPYIGGSPDTSIPPFAYSNVGALWCWSDNYGLTWRLEHAILVGDKAQACAPPVRTADGTLLIPAYVSLGGANLCSSVLYRSHDGGETWSEGTVMARGCADTRDYNEPGVIELEPGHLLCLHRTTMGEGGAHTLFWQNESHDAGHTWSPPEVTTVRSGACPRLAKLRDGRLLLTYGRRLPPYGIYASISEDGGRSWGRTSWLVRKTPEAARSDHGYTSSIQLDDTRILTTSYAQWRGITGITGTFWELP
jgi:hypothetical protein